MSAPEIFDLLDPLERIAREQGAAGSASDPVEGRGSPAAGRAAPPPALDARLPAAFLELIRLLPALDFDALLRAILDLAIRHTAAERGLLVLLGEDGRFEVEIARNDRGEPIDPAEVATSRPVVRRALDERRPVVASGPGLRAMSDSVASPGPAAAMCVPLGPEPFDPAQGRPIGALYVDGGVAERGLAPSGPTRVVASPSQASLPDSAPRGFGAAERDFFVALAGQATAALVAARLYRAATTDPLSGLPARAHLRRALAEAAGAPCAVLLADLDGLKALNQRHGRTAGDRAIRETGEVLRRAARAAGACFRYGGGELAVVLPGADERAALARAEEIRAAVEAHRFGPGRLRLTVSIGAAVAPAGARDPEAVLKRADQALWHAKAAGRNRVVAWTGAIGAAGKRKDILAGIVTGDFATDHANTAALIDAVASIGQAAADVGRLLTVAVDKVVDATGAERGALMLGEPGALATVVARDRAGADLDPEAARFSRTVPERVLATGESVFLEYPARDGSPVEPGAEEAGAPGASASIAALELRTIMCVPLATARQTLGVIYVDSRAGPGDLRASSLPFFEGLARHVATALENARLRARLIYEEGAGAP